MECEPLTADEANIPAKSNTKRSVELLHIIQNLIPNGVVNI
jgi:hypothetical protein